MAGRKNFVAGEILLAADVNAFLMDQSVMVFDDDDARATAIPTPSAGMVTYRVDADALEKFDGSDFVDVSPGGLIAVKSAIRTSTQTFASVGAGDNRAVGGLSITHEVADPANRLIISAFVGAAANSNNRGAFGIAVNDGLGFISVGDSEGSRLPVTAGGWIAGSGSGLNVSMPSVTFVHTPGAGSKTYTVRVFNVDVSARTLFINRNGEDADNAANPRAVSSITIQEVAV